MLSNLKYDILPILYTSTIISAIMYLFNPTLLPVYSIGFTLFLIFEFAFLHRLKSKKAFGGLVYFLFAAIVFSMTFVMLTQNPSPKMEFIEWFFIPQSDSTIMPEYSAALAVNMAVFGGGIVFYFTDMLYRPFFLFLLSFIPSAIASKSMAKYPIYFGAAILALFLLICISYRPCMENTRLDFSKLSTNSGGGDFKLQANKAKKPFSPKTVLMLGWMFLFFPFLMSTIEYKPNAPMKSAFDSFANSAGLAVNSGNGINTNFTQNSSGGGKNDYFEELMFTVTSEKPLYLRRQVFDIYDEREISSGFTTLHDEKYNTGYDDWESEREKSKYSDFVDSLKWLVEEYADKYGEYFPEKLVDGIKKSNPQPTKKLGCTITIINNPTQIIFNPPKTISVFAIDDNQTVYKTIKDEFFTEKNMSPNESYSIFYYEDTIDENLTSLFSSESYIEWLEKIIQSEWLDKTNEHFPYLLTSYNDAINAKRYYINSVMGGTAFTELYNYEELLQLVNNIIGDAKGDLEKAQRLEAFFHQNDFVYNSDYVEANTAVSNFVFNIKNGICGDFSSAMIIMARLAGLPARNVSGFSVSELAGEDVFNVRYKHAHAFPEIYISGYGWKIFEPTVSLNSNFQNEKASEETTDNFTKYTITAAVLIGLIFLTLIIISLRNQLSQMFFSIKFFFAKNEKKAKILFVRIQKLTINIIKIEENEDIKQGIISPKTAEITAKKYLEVNISDICNAFDEITYGGKATSEFDTKGLYAIYCNMYKKMRTKYR